MGMAVTFQPVLACYCSDGSVDGLLNSKRPDIANAGGRNNRMDEFLAVLLFFGVLIGIGILVSTYLYNSGVIGRRRFRLRRRANAVEMVPVESDIAVTSVPVEVEEEEVIDVP
jgi:hypothetical protein